MKVGVTDNLEIVPFDVLTPPSREESRGIWRRESAEVLDQYLRRLARQEAVGRRVVGTLAQRLLQSSGHKKLGFARISDYARERLGLSGRELQSLAKVSENIESLPEIAAAFESGALNWTKLRLLASVATVDTESTWLRLAADRPASRLEGIIKEYRRNTPAADDIDPAAGIAAADTGKKENKAAATHPEAGSITEISLESCAEHADDSKLIDGEPATLFRIRCPRRVRSLWRRMVMLAQRVTGAELSQWHAAEAIAAEAVSGAAAGPPEPTGLVGSAARHGAASGPSMPAANPEHGYAPMASESSGGVATAAMISSEEADQHLRPERRFDLPVYADLRETIDWSPVREAIPAAVADLAVGLDDLDAHQLDERLRTVFATLSQVDWQLGRLLRTFFSLRLYGELGFPTSASYISDRLGISVRKARGLVTIDRKSWQVGQELTDAYRHGELSWLKTLALLPVVSECDLKAWIARAQEVTLRRLIDEVAWALELLDHAPSPFSVSPPPADARLELDEVQIGARLAERFSADSLAQAALSDLPNADIKFYAPASVVSLLNDATACLRKPHEAEWRAFERVLIQVKACWEGQPRHRDPVFQRDGWRCRVPACSSRINLHDHHLVFRSQGGTNKQRNRVAVCASHHYHGVHMGRILASGDATGHVIWELGVRPDKPPLLRLCGDRYLPTEQEENPMVLAS